MMMKTIKCQVKLSLKCALMGGTKFYPLENTLYTTYTYTHTHTRICLYTVACTSLWNIM